jgi:hypothetical protein
VCELLKRGLTTEGFMQAVAGEKSQDFGVTQEDGRQRGDGRGADGS